MSPLHAAVLGTAWLTAYRALFTNSGLRAGERVLVQGATGGMATALIQLGRAAGFEVWVTSRSVKTRAIASRSRHRGPRCPHPIRWECCTALKHFGNSLSPRHKGSKYRSSTS